MKSLLLIRERLGITGPQLATILGVERSTIRKAEAFQRSLPTKACHKLISIEDIIRKGEPVLAKDPAEEAEYFSKHEERFEDCMMQSRILQRELDKQEKEHEQGQNLLKVLDAIEPDTHMQRICIDGLRRRWIRKLKNCSSHARQYLKDRIIFLRNEARQIGEILESRRMMNQLLTEKN